MKILSFAASTSSTSINKALATHATEVFKSEIMAEAEITLIDLKTYEMAIYSADYENEHGIPDQAHSLFKLIGEHDGLIISFAEHNANFTAAFKNTFDWMTRIDRKVYGDKPIVALSTSPGPGGGANVMKIVENGLPHFAGNLVGSLSVPSFGKSFDQDKGALIDDDLTNALKEKLQALAAALKD